jgi:hypothetical protein
MRLILLLVVATCAACDGIAIGDPGLDPPRTGPCSAERFVVLDDLTRPAVGFVSSPNALLEAARHRYGGMLELREGGQVPVTVQMTLDENAVLAKYRTDSQESSCPHWLTAKVEILIDAGVVLNGRAMGVITTPDHARVAKTQISTALIAFDSFQSTLSPPMFQGEVSSRPSLSLAFTLEDPDTWQADWNFAAVVATNSGALPSDKTEFVALGKAELNATDRLDSGDAGG